MKSRIVSFRLPEKAVVEIEDFCKENDISRSKFITECVTDNTDKYKSGGIIVADNIKEHLITVGGGSLMGIVIYKTVKASLMGSKRHTADEIELYSITAGVAVAIMAGYGLRLLMKIK